MALFRFFAYRSGYTEALVGTIQIGDIAIGVDESLPYLENYGGVEWIVGPNEETKYIIAQAEPFRFSGSIINYDSFINLIKRNLKGTVTKYNAKDWILSNGWWTNYINPYPPKLGAGGYHTNVMKEDTNKIWSWGYNLRGQLGDNTNTSRITPVSIFGTNKTFCHISAGYYHSSAIDYKGKVWGWGYNLYGHLGDNTTVTKKTPVAVYGNKTFCYIGAGYRHTIAIDYQGKAWSWGWNSYGHLGDNTIISRLTPVAICGNKTFCYIGVGQHHNSAIDHSGQAWTWGQNNKGQIGDNTIISRLTPVSIHGSKKTFCHISVEYYHSTAIDYRGKVWGWGYNNHGQLGNNSTTNLCTPVAVYGNKTFCYISTGVYHTMAIDFRGKIWTWGFNQYGELGNNTTTQHLTPIAICGNKTFCYISSGYYYSTAIDYQGKVWVWGQNNYGQLGDNTMTSRRTPIRIYNM